MIILQPYLKDYKSKAEVLADFNAGKDFILNDMNSRWDGKPISIRDLEGLKIEFRYAKDRKFFIHEA